MSDPKHPVVGSMSIDATDVEQALVTPEQIKHFSKVRPGFELALAALAGLTPEQAKALGISEADRVEALDLQPKLAQLDELIPPTAEMLRRLHNARLQTAHRAATLVHAAKATAMLRADRDPAAATVLGALTDLVEYTQKPAAKGKVTKAKKAKKAKKTPAGGGSTPA